MKDEKKDEKILDLLTILSDVEDGYIKDAAPKEPKQAQNRTTLWRKWGTIAGSAAAACLCLVAASSILNGRHRIPAPVATTTPTPANTAIAEIDVPFYPPDPNVIPDKGTPPLSETRPTTAVANPSTQERPAATTAPAATLAPTIPANSDTYVPSTPGGSENENPDRVFTGTDNFPQEDEGFTSWHGKNVTFRLESVLEKPCDTEPLFAICARPSLDLGFSYQGKTIAEYEEEWGRLNDLPEKLQQLIKEGDALKYGETLYLTGTPDGERWSQELYEKRIEFYGTEIMSAYFADGEFFKDKLLEDINSFWLDIDRDGYISTDDMEATWNLETLPAGLKALKDAENACKDAVKAYLAQLAPSLPGAYPSKVLGEKNCILFYMTKEDFAAFSREGWFFDLALEKDVDVTDGVIFLAGEVDWDCVEE